MRITKEWLAGRRACQEEIDLFVSEWPDGVEVSEAALLRALNLGLGLDWFVENALPKPLLAEYGRQEAALLAEYERQAAALWAEYERQAAPLWAEYRRQKATLLWQLLESSCGRQP